MKVFLLPILLVFTVQNSYSQQVPDYNNKQVESCRNKWIYFSLKSPKVGEVISHIKAGPCGTLAFASVSIIRLETGDTIRVLDLCNDKDDYVNKTKVFITPSNSENYYYSNERRTEERPAIAVAFFYGKNGKAELMDCLIKKTCYGSVTLKK